jgi:cellulase
MVVNPPPNLWIEPRDLAQIEVTGSGTNTGSNMVSFPGAYPANHPGIVLLAVGRGAVFEGPTSSQSLVIMPGAVGYYCGTSCQVSMLGGRRCSRPAGWVHGLHGLWVG